jgi:DamX protein
MIPDLRFVIGAVLATALLGVTAFGLGAAVHIAHQSKVGPLEASRMLAYTPNDSSEMARQAGGPFADIANIPKIPAIPPVVQAQPATAAPEPVRTADAAAAEGAAPTAAVPPLDDTDAVDERAVIDPPLPVETDPPSPETTADTAPVPAPAVTVAPASDPAPVVTTAPVPEPAPPVTTAIAPAPVVEIPAEPSTLSTAPDIEPVGSIQAVEPSAAEASSAPPANAAPSTRNAAPKAKRPARKALAKAKPKPKLRANARVIQPTASTGYPVTSGYAVTAPAARARGGNSSKGHWSDF